jgi:hypothetical protein
MGMSMISVFEILMFIVGLIILLFNHVKEKKEKVKVMPQK